MFHLDPPPNFQPFDSRGEMTLYQRHLPHWRQQGATYFVTFRLADSLPQEKVRELQAMQQEAKNASEERKEELSRTQMIKIEKWLDSGFGECLLKNPDNLQIVHEALRSLHGTDYELGAMAIMPNHVHALIRPSETRTLEEILKSRKQWTSRRINRRAETSGALWQAESYDRIVRDGEHLWKVLQYIGRNPAKAGIKEVETMRWVSPTWQECGWGFVD